MDRKKILTLVKKYYEENLNPTAASKHFKKGQRISYAGRVYDEKELINLVDASLDFWLTTGRFADEFETRFASFLNIKNAFLVNSGSSANLLAFMALTSDKLKDKKIKRGDEIITVAAGFPTTVTPMLQYGAVPVFVDVTIPEYNVDVRFLDKALSKRTKAVMLAHTLGNPFDVETVKKFCDENGLWLIEDNCDSLGSKYQYKGEWKYTGTFGHIGTSSFYPPHHMTMGEGGAVYTDDLELAKIILSLRDWGRDCFCPSGKDNTCKKRFTRKFGELPRGYDHKYVYSHFGYNLKVTDMQAAIGCAQLEKLPAFIEKRKKNWNLLKEKISHLGDRYILPEPSKNSDPSWFGFLLTVRNGTKRNDVVNHLEENGVQTRMLFAGNILRHPCFDEMRKRKTGFRVVGKLNNTDRIVKDTFWIGVYPGMTEEMIAYMARLLA
ncbi:MAG TPA: lipopolysaccharide biosynthesis protein RfbH [Alphaproteobacteria bacterium]|nr:lipopolysaccharide biosynthesis protein RfbH [Alphaproteobacteria bacterium]